MESQIIATGVLFSVTSERPDLVYTIKQNDSDGDGIFTVVLATVDLSAQIETRRFRNSRNIFPWIMSKAALG